MYFFFLHIIVGILCAVLSIFHGYTIVYTSIVLYRPCFTVVFSCCFLQCTKRVVEPQLWSGCFELTVEVLDTAVTQAPQLLFLFLSFFALSFFIDCEAPRGTVAEGGLRYATRPLHTICHGLNACLLPPSARACMCAHCLRLN